MSYTVLARKYRPQRFSDVIGQDHVTRTLQNALEQQRIAHGYIFSGHRGIGKTTIARILAMCLNCKSSDRPVTEPCGVCDSCREIRDGSVGAMDVIEIDAATNRGIEEVRGIISTATAEPARDRFRIFILDEAHQVTDAAFNALLKTLEEPPSWVVFMMATTQPEDIPQTIRSRCQHFSFHAVKFEDIVGQLKSISAAENLVVDDDAIALLAEAGDGSMRDALSIMDQAIACCGTTLTADLVRGLIGSVSSDVLEHVMNAVHGNNSEEVLRIVDKLMVEGHSATHFARQFVRFLRNAIVAKVAGGETSLLQISSDEKARVARTAELFSEEDLTRFLQIMLRTHGDVSYKQEQRFHLELGLLKLVHAQRLLPLEQLLSGARLAEAPAAESHATSAPAARSAAPSAGTSRPSGLPRPGGMPAPPSFGGSPRPTTPSSRPSPFEADRARKSKPEMSDDHTPSAEATAPAPHAGTAAFGSPAPAFGTPATPEFAPRPAFSPNPTPSTGIRPPAPPVFGSPRPVPTMAPPVFAPRSQPAPEPPHTVEHGAAVAVAMEAAPVPQESSSVDTDALRDAICTELEGSSMAVSAIEEADLSIVGSQLNVTVSMSQAMINVTFGNDQKKAITTAAARFLGRPVKLNFVSGTPTSQPSAAPKRSSGGGGNLRGRAADEPVVKRMIEKFGAEIRTVIDNS